jgi:hypothetical protein
VTAKGRAHAWQDARRANSKKLFKRRATQAGGMDLSAGRQVGASKCEVIFKRALS